MGAFQQLLHCPLPVGKFDLDCTLIPFPFDRGNVEKVKFCEHFLRQRLI